MKFDLFVQSIQDIYTSLQEQAIKSINRNQSRRNWHIGFYIGEFEQKGEESVTYGEALLQNLVVALLKDSLFFRNLKLFRQFYLTAPQVGQSASAQLQIPSEKLIFKLFFLTLRFYYQGNTHSSELSTT